MWAFVCSGVAALIVAFVVRVVPMVAATTSRRPRADSPIEARYPADSLARVVVGRDLFRSDRRSATIAYDPSRGAAPLPDGPPKPQLVLTGVVWGSEPEAVVEGLPTSTGPRVVRAGDVVGGVTIKRIEVNRLVAMGFDTTWTLTVRVPWK